MNRFILIIIGLLFIMSMAACSEKDNAKEKEELKEVEVMLDWYPNAVHSFLYVAKENGYFEEEGIDVSIQFPSNTTDPINLAASGKITLGFYYQPDVIMARANEDIPVKSVGAVVRKPLNYLVFQKDQDISTPADLIDKDVGYPGIAINEALATTILKDVGEDPNDVELIDVGFELGSAIISDNADAVFGAYINHEVPVLEEEGHDIDYLNPVDFGVPEYSELVVVTGDNTWEKKQEEIEAFWRAAQKGFDFMEENPDEALTILLENQDEENFPLEESIERESMEILLPKMKSENGLRHQEEASWEETAEWLKEEGLIEDVPAMDDLFVE